jgi:mycothiol system anti-sigma-R factor
MSCQELVQIVTDYLDENLDHPTRARFEEHLAQCAGCERYLNQMRETIRVLGHVAEETVPAEMRQRLLTAFRDWRDVH